MLNNGTKIDAFFYFVIIYLFIYLFSLTSLRDARARVHTTRDVRHETGIIEGAITEHGNKGALHSRPSPFLSRHSNGTHHDLLFQTIDQTMEWNRLATGTTTVLKRGVIPFRAF